jgi:hypothetical protein
MSKTDKMLVLRFGCESDRGYVHFYARPMGLDTSPEMRERRNCAEGYLDKICSLGAWGGMRHLRVWSQGSNGDTPRYLYAQELQFRDLYALDTSELAGMHKVANSIEAYLERERQRDGYPDSFGRFVGRVARALKVKYIAFENTNKAGGYHYRLRDIGEAINYINHAVEQWVRAGVNEDAAAV